MSPRRDLIETLESAMRAAIGREDFETAATLRDRIGALKDGEPTALRRQQPGAMGLGTSQEVPLRPAGWKPPPKPDLMTRGRR